MVHNKSLFGHLRLSKEVREGGDFWLFSYLTENEPRLEELGLHLINLK
jgi:hypothetical protein